MLSRNYFTFPFYVPRICQQWQNWPRYLFDYVLRRQVASEYTMRNGVKLVDDRGTLAGTIAVVFVRQEYGALDRFKIIVDVGANIGIFTVFAAQSSPGARIYCFEPESANFHFLKRNIENNALGNRVTAFQCAVASQPGERDLGIGGSLTNSFQMAPDGANVAHVKCTTLAEILDNHELDSVDLLKLNCEGSEYEILEGCSKEDLSRIANIRLEYHNLEQPGRNGKSLSRFLESRGYRIERFTTYLSTSGFNWATRMLNAPKMLLAILPELMYC
jgi:FkbM family methyltransferase